MKRFVIFSLILSSSFLISCFDHVCPDFDLENGFSISFSLIEEGTGNSLLGIGTYYHRDSVQVFYEDGAVLFEGPVATNGEVYLQPYFLKNVNLPLDKDSTEVYFLHLNRSTLDVDTFEVSYRVSMADCNDKSFSRYSFFYNGELVRSFEEDIESFHVILEKSL